MICVKLLPQREVGLRLSISTHHLRMVLISPTRRRSFCRRVRLLQNDLSTPSSPVALLSMPHTSLSTVAMATVWQGWVVSKALWSLAKTPLHTYLCYVALIPSFWSSFDGDIKPGGIQDVPYKTLCYCLTGWDANSPRTDALVRLGCSPPATRYCLIICSPQLGNLTAVRSTAFFYSTLWSRSKNNELQNSSMTKALKSSTLCALSWCKQDSESTAVPAAVRLCFELNVSMITCWCLASTVLTMFTILTS